MSEIPLPLQCCQEGGVNNGERVVRSSSISPYNTQFCTIKIFAGNRQECTRPSNGRSDVLAIPHAAEKDIYQKKKRRKPSALRHSFFSSSFLSFSYSQLFLTRSSSSRSYHARASIAPSATFSLLFFIFYFFFAFRRIAY